MSNKAQAWAWTIPVGGVMKLVLIALADHSDDDGRCWPGVRGIAAKCGVTQRTVEKNIAGLRDDKWVRVEARMRDDGSRTSNFYFLNLAKSAPDGESASPGGEYSSPGGSVYSSPPGEENRGTRTPREPSDIEPSVEPLESKSKISQNSQNQESSENDDDQTIWPKWYANGYAVPGWKVSLERAEAWRVEAGIPEALAEIKSYALRDWWERLPEDSARRKKGNPWLTFQNWCRDERDAWVERNKGKPTTGYNEEERIARFRADSEEYKANWAGAAAERESVP